jgi:RNA polymerase sigma factor (sigma-70 family)
MNVENLYKKYGGIIKKVALTYPINDMDLDDVIGELNIVFLNCVKNYDKNKSKFTTYLWQSCVYEIYRMRRQKYNKDSLSLDYETDEGYLWEAISDDLNILDELFKETEISDIIDGLDDMKYGYYTKMFVLYQIPQKQMAKIENKSISFIQKQHSKNIKELKKKFSGA